MLYHRKKTLTRKNISDYFVLEKLNSLRENLSQKQIIIVLLYILIITRRVNDMGGKFSWVRSSGKLTWEDVFMGF